MDKAKVLQTSFQKLNLNPRGGNIWGKNKEEMAVTVKAGDREFLFYKLVLMNKASMYFHTQPIPKIGDLPPLAIEGFYCFECKEVAMPVKDEDADVECEELADKLQPKGFVLVAPKVNQLSDEFQKSFWERPASNYVNEENYMLEYKDMPEYKEMLELWPSFSKHESNKCWKFHCIKNKVGLECKNDRYLALVTRLGKKWINHFWDEFGKQAEYGYGFKKNYSCKNFQLWVNRVFKHKVDCRFHRLHNDERYFGLEEIGILGKLYLDDLTWELVDLVVPEANVNIDDESKFYLQKFGKSMENQLLKLKMDAGKGK